MISLITKAFLNGVSGNLVTLSAYLIRRHSHSVVAVARIDTLTVNKPPGGPGGK